jgi:hypothetical protein
MPKFERGPELQDKALLPGGFAEHYLEALYTEVGPKFAEITEQIFITCVTVAVDKLTAPSLPSDEVVFNTVFARGLTRHAIDISQKAAVVRMMSMPELMELSECDCAVCRFVRKHPDMIDANGEELERLAGSFKSLLRGLGEAARAKDERKGPSNDL